MVEVELNLGIDIKPMLTQQTEKDFDRHLEKRPKVAVYLKKETHPHKHLVPEFFLL